mgnify:FL=1
MAPLAVEFGTSRSVIGFEINTTRNDALRARYDATHEVSTEELTEARESDDFAAVSINIATDPVPADAHKLISGMASRVLSIVHISIAENRDEVSPRN